MVAITIDATPWNPPVGRLFVETCTDPDGPRIARLGGREYNPRTVLCYRLTDDGRFRYSILAYREGDKTFAVESVHVERDIEPATYKTETDILIERRMATDDDIRTMLCAWFSQNQTPEQWLLCVRLKLRLGMQIADAPLHADEIDRLRRIVAEVQRR